MMAELGDVYDPFNPDEFMAARLEDFEQRLAQKSALERQEEEARIECAVAEMPDGVSEIDSYPLLGRYHSEIIESAHILAYVEPVEHLLAPEGFRLVADCHAGNRIPNCETAAGLRTLYAGMARRRGK